MKNRDELVVVLPGKGTDSLMLGCSTTVIRQQLGKPELTNTYSDEIWWSFFQAGIDCGFERARKVLIAVNFFREGVAGHKQALASTKEGLCPGVPRIVVVQRFGKPDDSGEGWTDRDGKWHRSWIKYSSGIAFEFGHDDKADVMTVYPADTPKGQ
ncbi:MAG TPA: hypothetical protein VFQ41_24675 [Candidatus Angelobacter sp.]|nr:hypothetical protein [Candidatus Angelobacter sp.]